MQSLTKKLIWPTLFSIAMGFMETAVVVYLRKIYYPNGFQFPLIPIDGDIALIEFLREVATIIMLLGIGIIAGKNTSQKFAFFIYCFAIWDIFYYVFLKILIDWPQSLFTWDILFIIPIPWVGPVLAPCIISLTMIVFMLYIVYLHEKGYNTKIVLKEWLLLCIGSLVSIISFLCNYIMYINQGNSINNIWTLSNNKPMFQEIIEYVPTDFNWGVFILGELIIVYTIIIYVRRIKNE